jgi:hypothetical protein
MLGVASPARSLLGTVVVVVDPVSLIVGALAAGVSAGVRDTATAAVKEAYQRLKTAVSARFAGHQSAEMVLTQHETDPDTWVAPLEKVLRETGAADDPAVVAAAEQLLWLLRAAGGGVSAGVGGVAAGGDVTVHADHSGVAGGVIQGGVSMGTLCRRGRPGPDRSRRLTPAAHHQWHVAVR